MPSYSRRDALKTIPALAAGLAGCASLTGRDDSLPMPTAWTADVRTPTRAVRPPSGPLLVGTESQFRDDPMVSALDPATGEERWAVTGGKGRRSPLGFDDRHAYLFSRAERATAVDYEAGERAWSTELTGVDRADPGVVQYPPAVAGDTVFVGSATEELLALDAATGEVRWRAPLQNTVFSRPLVADGRVYVGGADYFLYAFDAASGTRLWRDELAAPVTRGPTRVDDRLVTVVGSDILVRGHSGTVPFDPTALYVHATDGTLVDEQLFERTPDGGRVNWAVAVGGGVYVGQEWQLARLAPEVLDAE